MENALTQQPASVGARVPPIDYLGPAPLLDGEDQDAYNALLAQVSAAVKPKDVIEEILVADIVRFTWLGMRYRRLSATLLNAIMRDKLLQFLQPLVGGAEAFSLSKGHEKRDPEAMARLNLKDEATGVSMMDTIAAQSLSTGLTSIERIDQLAMNAEISRNMALRQVEAHRKALAQMLREQVKNIEDAEFAVVNADEEYGSEEEPQ